MKLNCILLFNKGVAFLILLLGAQVCLAGQRAPIKIGAQVYIEPGQTREEIAHYFRLLADQHMTVCRIRMDEAHIRQGDGHFDFSLYDMAFEEAYKNGVSIFATIFPANLLSDANSASGVGGFKFPVSSAHLLSIANYVRQLVEHFKGHPALECWVLQNEPGVAGNVPENDFARDKWDAWLAQQPEAPQYNGFMQIQYQKEQFIRDYTTWYLNWLANEVRKYDAEKDLHVNPHMIFRNLADYDFPSWHKFLAHLGASMHPSWHFSYFDRNEYPLAVAANCEIIRTGAGHLPFWVTELQGGNNNFSGYNPLMPTKEEIAMWMWTSIASGTEGIIFWTLNPRATGFEAGEWALIDFQRKPTARLGMAGRIAQLLQEQPDLQRVEPVKAEVFLLYSPESLVLQRKSEIVSPEVSFDYEARKEAAHVKSLLAFYRVANQQGVGAQIFNMDQFDWEAPSKGKTVVLANMAVVPRSYYPRLISFVARGGRLLVTGQTAHFDEHVFNVMYGEWPLRDLFGASIKEFKADANRFDIPVGDFRLQAHFLRGVIDNQEAQPIGINSQNEVLATRHFYGLGEVVWVPSMIGLADWQDPEQEFSEFVMSLLQSSTVYSPVKLKDVGPGFFVKHFKGENGLYSLLVNKSGVPQTVQVSDGFDIETIVFQLKPSGKKKSSIHILHDDCVIVKWRSH